MLSKTERLFIYLDAYLLQARHREVVIYTNSEGWKSMLEKRFPGTRVEVLRLETPDIPTGLQVETDSLD